LCHVRDWGRACSLLSSSPLTTPFHTWLCSHRRRAKNTCIYGIWGISYAFITACIGTFTNIFMKGSIEMISLSIAGDNQSGDFYFWLFIILCILCALTQLTATVWMMCTFPAVFIVPLYQCLFIISLIVGGGVYFQEFDKMDSLAVVFFSIGVIICFSGIFIITAMDLDEEGTGPTPRPVPECPPSELPCQSPARSPSHDHPQAKRLAVPLQALR
jgi:hypothetical protein